MNDPNRPYETLPPLHALVCFEAAARHGGFKAAAGEMNVTPAAISHQIKALEQDLQVSLFVRHHRGVALTETGALLFAALQRSLGEMSAAVEHVRRLSQAREVKIHASTAVSTLWLSSRLGSFWRSHQHVPVVQIVSDDARPPAYCDLVIHYGAAPQIGAIERVLFRDSIVPLCSPEFRNRHPISSLEALSDVPLIHHDAPHTGWTSWTEWCALVGAEVPLRAPYKVNNYVNALQAAEEGVGAVLGWTGLTKDLVDSGRLVPLLPIAARSPHPFRLELRATGSELARLVFAWLSSERQSGGDLAVTEG
ncbi:MAG: LysR family transcriptional regulator [Rhodospirillaceae bacterium]